jgi:hypothetical protein
MAALLRGDGSALMSAVSGDPGAVLPKSRAFKGKRLRRTERARSRQTDHALTRPARRRCCASKKKGARLWGARDHRRGWGGGWGVSSADGNWYGARETCMKRSCPAPSATPAANTWITQTQLNSAAANSRAMSLVAAYERDHVTGAPDSKLFQGTESLSFGAVTLSFGSIRRSRCPIRRSRCPLTRAGRPIFAA